MAEKDYVLNLDVNTTKFLQSIKTAENATTRMQKTLGSQAGKVEKVLGGAGSAYKRTGKVIDATTGKLKNLGREVASSSTKVKLANGAIGTYTETAKVMKDKTTQVTGSFKQASTSTDSFVQRLGMLAKRAVGVVLVWSTLRAGMMAFNRIVKSSLKFLVEWEYQLAQIAIVGNASASQLSTLSGALIQVGKDFGISVKDLGEASKLWSQQGRAIEEIIPLMRTTAQLALITGQTTTQAVEDLTAVLKAYKIEARDSINIVDTMTNVMTKHAITAKDLASAYKQVASTASVLGVSFEELTGFITAIKAVTRDSGSKIGLSLRTMFSRITTSSADSIQNLASVPLFIDNMGRATFAVTPRMRALGDVISELSLKFGSLGSAQKSQLATLIGGVRRQNQVFALFDNFTESVEAQTDALFGLGKASEAISILTNTSKIGIDKLKNSWFSFVESIANSDVIRTTLTSLTNVVSALDKALAPDKSAYKEALDLLNKQNDEFSRQGNFANAVSKTINQITQLEEQSLRASDAQNTILNARANIYRKAFNEASRVAGVDFKVDTTGGLNGLLDQLKALEDQAKILKFDSVISQKVVSLKTSVLGVGQEIGKVLDDLSTKDISIAISRSGGDTKKELEEIFKLFEKISKSSKTGKIISQEDINNVNKALTGISRFSDTEREAMGQLLSDYNAKNDLLSDEKKLREDMTDEMQNELDYAEDIVLKFEKQQIINKIILKDQLERMKLAGALNSEILKAEGFLKNQLGIEDKIGDRLSRQLALEREKTKEQRLQGKLGSDSIKLFNIAKTEGTEVAKKIGDVLAKNIDFATFVRQGGKELDIFKKEFAGVFEQKQAEQFLKGLQVSGEKGLRGGSRIAIAEEGIRDRGVSRVNPQVLAQQQRLFKQEQASLQPVTQVNIAKREVNIKVEASTPALEEKLKKIVESADNKFYDTLQKEMAEEIKKDNTPLSNEIDDRIDKR